MKKTEIENKHLAVFIQSAKLHIKKMDELMQETSSVERGRRVAEEMNRFNMDLDLFLHIGLEMSFDKMKTILTKGFKL